MPDWPQEIREALAPLSLHPIREAEVIEELSQHLRDRQDELLANGVGAEQSNQLLLKELHDGTLVSGLKSAFHSARPAPPNEGAGQDDGLFIGLWRDLRYGVRILRMNPGFAVVAILSLALGIGANTTIFQLLDAVRLRTLPVKAPQQLAKVHIDSARCCRGDFYSNNADLTGVIWERLRTQQQAFSGIAAWSPFRFNLGQGGEARYADTLMVSGDFFNVLGLQPILGRLLAPADDFRGCGAQGVVLSYTFWQREFGGRTQILGSGLTLDGHPFQIMGVAPPSFYGMEVGRTFDVAIALCSQPIFSRKQPLMERPDSWWLAAVGRLKPGWTIERASSQLAAISPGIFAATLPETFDAPARKDYLSFRLAALPVATGVSELRHDYEDPLLLLLALSGLVLLIACANLANLMLARASVRAREMALRLTLGASRARLLRQMLAESLLLAFAGTLAGTVLAQILSRLLVAFLTTERNRIFVELTPDWRVLGFTTGLTLLTCVFFGLAPALHASRTEPGMAMRSNNRGATAGRERFLLRRLLVVSQVALSLVLLAGAFLFVRTFRNLAALNAGFRQDHILVANFDFGPLKLPPENQAEFKRELVRRVRAIPEVSSAAETLIVPMSHTGWDDDVDFPDGPQRQDVTFNRVSEGYFRTMETQLLAGRDFNSADTAESPRVAIVNKAFVRKYFPKGDPIGKTFRNAGKPDLAYSVVGVVDDTKYYELREAPVPIVFVSFSQANGPEEHSTLMIRSEAWMPSLVAAVKNTANNLNPAMVLSFSVLKTQIHEGLLREQLMATLAGFFGVLATVLAMIGLYGVISFMVIRRRNEIGVRMALGASRKDILVMILREAGLLLGAGLAAGTALALALGTTAASMLYGLKPRDPLTFAAALGGMVLVSLIASLLPAQRAAAVQPMAALREE